MQRGTLSQSNNKKNIVNQFHKWKKKDLKACDKLMTCPGWNPVFILRQLWWSPANPVTLNAGESGYRKWKDGGEKKSKIESPLFSELIETSIRMHERIAIARIDLFLISLDGRLVLGQPAEVWLQFHVKYPSSCPSTSINLWDATANTGPEIASL